MKGGRAAAEPAATVLEGGQKLPIRYKGKAEAEPSNYVLISAGGKVGAENNGGDGRSFGSGGSGSVIVRPPH